MAVPEVEFEDIFLLPVSQYFPVGPPRHENYATIRPFAPKFLIVLNLDYQLGKGALKLLMLY